MDLVKLAIVVLALGSPPQSQAAISIQNFSPATNDRFADDPSFTGNPHDWSGVGRSGDGKWAVMISPSVFLSATHHHPADGALLTFYPGNDPGSAAVTGTIATSQQIAGTDLWIGTLASPLAGSIAHYGFMTIPLSEATFTGSVMDDRFAYLSGLSPTVASYGASPLTNQAVGTNRVEGFQDSLSLGGSTGDVLILVENLAGDPGVTMTSFEANANGGDSGSPLMVISGGNLTIAGIAWAIGTVDIDPGVNEVTRNASAYTYVGNHAGEIAAYLAVHPVPEPGPWGLALFAAPALILRRHRERPGVPSGLPR